MWHTGLASDTMLTLRMQLVSDVSVDKDTSKAEESILVERRLGQANFGDFDSEKLNWKSQAHVKCAGPSYTSTRNAAASAGPRGRSDGSSPLQALY